MAKFRKKPVVIDAEKINVILATAQNKWSELPEWVKTNYEAGKLIFGNKSIRVQTLEGVMVGEISDYLICGIQGECYPCKRDIFNATYDFVE